MRIASYMTLPHKSEGHWTWWRDAVSVELGNELGRLLGATVDNPILPHGGGAFMPDRDVHYDIAFLPFGWYPADDKPVADWVYTFASDVTGYEARMRQWIERVHPNFIGCLQERPEWLANYERINCCRVARFPWWTTEAAPSFSSTNSRDVRAFCSGAIGRSYPTRTKVAKWLEDNRHRFMPGKVVTSCGPFGRYPLDRPHYLSVLDRTQYYVTAGIHDRLVPPKYVEVAVHGCCLVTPPMEWLDEYGFVDGVTCRIYRDFEELLEILWGEDWVTIGPKSQHLVMSCHRPANRAEQLRAHYCERSE